MSARTLHRRGLHVAHLQQRDNVNGALITNVGTVSIGYMSGGIASTIIGISNQLN